MREILGGFGKVLEASGGTFGGVRGLRGWGCGCEGRVWGFCWGVGR